MDIGKIAAAAAIAPLTAACVAMPDATLNYYLTTTEVSARLVRTVACTGGGLPIVSNAVTPTVRHSADTGTGVKSLRIRDIDGWAANTKLTMERFPDGRLKAVNSETAGQGSEVIKTAISLAEVALAAAGDQPDFDDECDLIAELGDGKPITLTYDAGAIPVVAGTSVSFEADPTSALVANDRRLARLLGEAELRIEETRAPVAAPVAITQGATGFTRLPAREPAIAALKAVQTAGVGRDAELWTGDIAAGGAGLPYDIPIPDAAMFGGGLFAAAFDESGALTKISYNADSGLSGGMGAVGAIIGAADETDAEELARLQTEANLIVQQQRVVACRADPAACE